MPGVLEKFFAEVGEKLEDHITLRNLEPACHYRWTDGSTLNLPFDVDAVPDAIEQFSPGNGSAVRAYLRDARELYELTKDIFLFRPFAGAAELMSARNRPLLWKLPQLRFWQNLHNVHRKRFSDKRVVQLFDRFATYNGSSPFRAPATLMVIPWVEIGLGAWYPEGGMGELVRAVARVAEKLGVNIQTGTRVRSIIHENNAVRGVILADESRIEANHVVSNVDAYTTRTELLGIRPTRTPELSSSGVVLHCAVDSGIEGLEHHNVFFADDYRAEFRHIEQNTHPHPDATVYVSRSVVHTPTHAPPGRENWFVLVNAPPNGATTHRNTEGGVWSAAEAEAVAQNILRRLRAFNVSPTVRAITVRTPTTMATEWGSYGGALYGSSSNSISSAFMRQPQQSKELKNLWYVGGSAHPGGGVPLVITSGLIASSLILSSP